jgi:RNA polymerase sigma-54 factor
MLIKSLEQRQSTLRRIAEVIVDNQYDFLEEGIEHLRPMTMQQVADKLGVHETTISRAIANKYIQMPSGLFEFKYFFSSGYQSSDGESLSSKSVKEKIRDFIMKEDPLRPLSDSKLSEMLKEQGIPVARRTVAKYREELGIQSSHLRKEF